MLVVEFLDAGVDAVLVICPQGLLIIGPGEGCRKAGRNQQECHCQKNDELPFHGDVPPFLCFAPVIRSIGDSRYEQLVYLYRKRCTRLGEWSQIFAGEQKQ